MWVWGTKENNGQWVAAYKFQEWRFIPSPAPRDDADGVHPSFPSGLHQQTLLVAP